MRSISSNIRRSVVITTLLSVLAITFTGTAVAQDPTPTPTSPIWRAYAQIRDAIEEEFNTDLTIVQSYDWEQSEFVNGIDDCVALDNPAAARPVYFGWTFVITDVNGTQYRGRVSFDLRDVAICDDVVQIDTPAPEVQVADTGDLPEAVAGSAATGGFELGGHILELNSNTVSLMQRSGMTWVKTQTSHSIGANATANAGKIDTAKANGFKILFGVVGNKEQLAADFDGYAADYSSYVAGLASLGADAIEVWNEPNIDREWPAGQISGENYTRLLAPASNAIRTANANTLVISGAPAPTGFFGAAGCTANGCNDDVFMQQMAAAGAAQYIDCVGLHYNEGIVPPSQVGGDPRGEYPTYYLQSMTQRGYAPFGGKQVCYTELGYLSGEGFSEPIPASFGWASNTTVAQHAAWLAEAASIYAQSGQVRMLIVWNVDFPFYTATDPMGGYAIFRPDDSCPACEQLGAVMGR
ncbi:MAG: hypothetical protein AAFV33_08840 [Chloroflexota bacterium]